MSEIGEMMLDGTLCQYCGFYLGGNTDYPISCAECEDEDE